MYLDELVPQTKELVDINQLSTGEVFVPDNVSTPTDSPIIIYIDVINIFADYTIRAAKSLNNYPVTIFDGTFIEQNSIEQNFDKSTLATIHNQRGFWLTMKPYFWHWNLIDLFYRTSMKLSDSKVQYKLLVSTDRYKNVNLTEMFFWIGRHFGTTIQNESIFLSDKNRNELLPKKNHLIFDTSKERALDWYKSGGTAIWWPEIYRHADTQIVSNIFTKRLNLINSIKTKL